MPPDATADITTPLRAPGYHDLLYLVHKLLDDCEILLDEEAASWGLIRYHDLLRLQQLVDDLDHQKRPINWTRIGPETP